MKKSVIIVAGGKGNRMNTDIPKQFLIVGNRPVLMHTIERFYNYDNNIKIVVVLPNEQHEYWMELCAKYHFELKHEVVAGGKERFFSVKNGLKCLKKEGVIAIHDGVRPLVSEQTIHNCFETAELLGNAIPVIDVVESMRFVDDITNYAVNRADYRLVQTPQIFRQEQIFEAYNMEYKTAFTDDASIVELCGHPINMVEGNRENIKITTPSDLILAEAYLKML